MIKAWMMKGAGGGGGTPWTSPTMTAADAPSPYIVSAKTHYDDDTYDAWKAMNGNADDYWNSNGDTRGEWFQLDCGEGTGPIITSCTIKNMSPYTFVSFNVQGSDFGVDYTDIYSGACLGNDNVQEFDFPENTTPYRYLRILNTYADNNSYVVCYEITFSGTR